MTKTDQRQPFSSHSGTQSQRERSRGSFSISSSSRATCAFGSTTKSCASTTRIQKPNGSARVCRSFRIASRSLREIARDLSKQSRPRCGLAKARSMSFRFQKTPNVERRTDHRPVRRSIGEGRPLIVDQEFPFSTGWHCAWCDLDIRPPTVGLFSFNNPLGACPDCRGFGRTIAIDLNKAIPDRSLSIQQGVVRAFRGAEFGESQKDLLCACAREEIAINVPFEELPRADQDFVIEGEKRSGEYNDEDYEHHRWYGVRGSFR